MEIILVPGLWLDAASWHDVTPALTAAGHTVHPLTMPGVGAPASESAEIGISDWVTAVVAEIDRLPGDVVVVGHSGGGNVVCGAVDQRPDRVARAIYVDTFPPTDGGSIWEFPVIDGVVPFPGWESFEEAEVGDLDEATRSRTAAAARSVPLRVPTDPIALTDERRHAVPATILTGTVPAEQIRALIQDPPAWAGEMASIQRLDIVELHSGHWPQFSIPRVLGDAIAVAASV